MDAKYGKPNSFKEETELDETDRSDAIEKQSKDNLTKSMKAMGKNNRQIKYVHKKTDDVIKKAAGEKVKKEEVEVQEELKGNQDKIDANHNGQIDGQDFERLRVKKDIAASRIEQQAKKKVKEGREFTEKLLETVRKSDVPAYLRKAKGDTPLTVADAKGPKKDSISAPENLAKARNEEVEQIDEISKTLAANYRHKAGQQAMNAFIDNKPTSFLGMNFPVSKKTAEKNSALIRKRGKGMSAAGERVSGAKPTSEEVEQIEERDEGKHNNGKTTGFKVVAAKAAKEYGSKEAGNRVAGAIRKKVLAKEDVTEQELDEALNEVLSKDASAGDWIHDFIHSDNPKFSGKSKAERKKMALGAYYGKHNEGYEGSEADEKEDKKGEKETGMTDAQYEKSARDKKEDKAGKKKMKEEVDTGITTDTLTGREAGGKSNDFKSFKLKVKGDHTPEKDPSCENPEETSSRQTIKAKGGLGDKVDNLDAKYGKPNSFKEEVVKEGKGLSPGQDDAPFDGPYTKTPSNVKDKSGAVHTPMSRAKDLARQAFKKIKNETMMGKISN